MPDKHGRTAVMIPEEVMRKIVHPEQERIFKDTGKLLTTGLVVRQLIEKGFAQNIRNRRSHVSSAN